MGPVNDDDRNRQAMASAANAAYYDAFERKDFATMASLWEPSDRTVCTHPGWPPIHGTDKILQSLCQHLQRAANPAVHLDQRAGRGRWNARLCLNR